MEFCHEGGVTFNCSTNIQQKTHYINRAINTLLVITFFLLYKSIAIYIYNVTTKETFDCGLLFTEAPCDPMCITSTLKIGCHGDSFEV